MREIPLTQGKVALVDDEDYEQIAIFKWCAYRPKRSKTFYACRGIVRDGKRTTEQMHRKIVDAKVGEKVDHKDQDGLNNTKNNIRRATNAQNLMNRGKQANNRSGYKGVFPSHPDEKAWIARIKVNRRAIHLGTFLTREEAAHAYDLGAIKHHGKFANLNYPRA
jgi:hypothetical protein